MHSWDKPHTITDGCGGLVTALEGPCGSYTHSVVSIPAGAIFVFTSFCYSSKEAVIFLKDLPCGDV